MRFRTASLSLLYWVAGVAAAYELDLFCSVHQAKAVARSCQVMLPAAHVHVCVKLVLTTTDIHLVHTLFGHLASCVHEPEHTA